VVNDITNQNVIAIYLPLAVVTAVLIMVAALKERRGVLRRQFIWLSVMTFGWQVCAIAFFMSPNAGIARYLFDLKLVFVAFTVAQVFAFALQFNKPNIVVIDKRTVVLLAIPAITSILALTSPLHPFIREQLDILQMQPLVLVENIRGIWFWVHTFYSYAMLVASMIVVIYHYRKLPRQYTLPSVIFAMGVLIALASNIVVLFVQINPAIDMTLVGLSIALVFLYVAWTASERMGLLAIARDMIFVYMDACAFVLDNDRNIVDCNLAAKQWMHILGIPESTPSFNDIIEQVWPDTDEATLQAATQTEGVDIYVRTHDDTHPIIYNLREHSVLDKKKRQIGLYVTLTDITRYKLLIDELEETARLDPLTGLLNRRAFEINSKELDTEDNLPFSIVLGDVNMLKTVNDTYGHQAGDLLLRLVSQVLVEFCPAGGSVYRIGGDEFVMLLPKTSQHKVLQMVQEVQSIFPRIKRFPFTPSVALGFATKETLTEDINDILKIADASMYKIKVIMKAEHEA